MMKPETWRKRYHKSKILHVTRRYTAKRTQVMAQWSGADNNDELDDNDEKFHGTRASSSLYARERKRTLKGTFKQVER